MARSRFREEKIRILMNEGYPFKQAVAIAYDKEKKGDEGLTTDPTDPKKSGTASDSLNVASLKSGIAQVESGGGQEIFMINPDPNSTATGLYGQRFSEIEDEYEGSRTQFSTDIQAQEEFMDKRIEEGINAPSLRRNAIDLTAEYKDQLGDKWDYTQNEVAALSHFLGRQGTREYFAAIRDGKDFVVPGTNKSPEEYLETFNEGEAKIKMRGGIVKPIKRGDNGVTTGEETEDPKDDDVYSVTHEDIYNYLASKDVNLKGREIAKTRIMPGRGEYFHYADAPGEEHDTLLGVKMGRGAEDTKDGGFRQHPLMIHSSRAGDEDVRLEEDIHSIQPKVGTLIKGMGGIKRKLARMLNKQYFTFDEGVGNEKFQALSDQEKSDLYKREMVEKNYALKGAGSSTEFEAKLISDKMQMIDQGVINPSGRVTKDDLQAIQQWYEKQNPHAAFLNPLFKNIDDSPRYTKILLQALNKA